MVTAASGLAGQRQAGDGKQNTARIDVRFSEPMMAELRHGRQENPLFLFRPIWRACGHGSDLGAGALVNCWIRPQEWRSTVPEPSA